MDAITIDQGQWIITEGGTPAYFIYELLDGKISVYSDGLKVNEMEAREGDKPIFLGIIAAIRNDRTNTASVRTDTQITVRKHSIDQVWGIVQNELERDTKNNFMRMIEAIEIKDDIENLNSRLAAVSAIDVKIPGDIKDDVKAILDEIVGLYKNIVK